MPGSLKIEINAGKHKLLAAYAIHLRVSDINNIIFIQILSCIDLYLVHELYSCFTNAPRFRLFFRFYEGCPNSPVYCDEFFYLVTGDSYYANFIITFNAT